MVDQPKPPPHLMEQIDRLFVVLQSVSELLQTGRAYGLAVGLSPALAQEMVRRHGDEAKSIVLNTWRIDPLTPRG